MNSDYQALCEADGAADPTSNQVAEKLIKFHFRSEPPKWFLEHDSLSDYLGDLEREPKTADGSFHRIADEDCQQGLESGRWRADLS